MTIHPTFTLPGYQIIAQIIDKGREVEADE